MNINTVKNFRSLFTPFQRYSIRSFSSTQAKFEVEPQQIESFLKQFDIQPKDIQSYISGLTHKSYQHASVSNSDRFHLLGERLTNLMITEHFLSKYQCSEKMLQQVTTALFSKKQINEILQPLNFETLCQFELIKVKNDKPVPEIFLTKQKNAMVSTCFNGLIGAIYYDQGWATAKKFIENLLFKQTYDISVLKAFEDPEKSVKVILSQKSLPAPTHEVQPRKDGLYLATIQIGSESVSTAVGYRPNAAVHRAYINLLSTKLFDDLSLLKF